MMFSQVMAEIKDQEIKREFSAKLACAIESIDALAHFKDENPEFSKEGWEFYNRIIMQLIDAHSLSK